MQRRFVNPMALFVISQYPSKQTDTKCNKKFGPSFMLLLQLNGPRLTQAKNCDNPLISLVLSRNRELESLLLVKNFRVVCCWLYPSTRLEECKYAHVSSGHNHNHVFFANWMSIIKMSPGIALFQILEVIEISSKNSELPV